MKWTKMFSLVCVAGVAVLLMGASSCEEFLEDPDKAFLSKTDQTPRYVLTVHEMIKYKRGGMIEQEVDSFFGGTVCVNRNPYIHSRDIKKIQMVPRPGNPDFYDIKVTLTSRGQKIWSAMAVARMDNKKFGILIDGMFYRSFVPPIMTEPSPAEIMDEKVTITIDGPFDPATAKGLEINSERNFGIFSK